MRLFAQGTGPAGRDQTALTPRGAGLNVTSGSVHQ
jgi:hypothetical protein